MTDTKVIIIAVVVSLILCAPLASIAGQQQQEPKQPRDTPEMVDKAFKIRYGDLSSIYGVIRSLNSIWGKVNVDRQSKTIFVHDTAEIVQKLSESIALMDIPPHQLRLTFFVFEAERGGSSSRTDDQLPAGVKTALDEVKKIMAYKNFRLVDSGLLSLLSTTRKGKVSLADGLMISIGLDYFYESKFLRLRLSQGRATNEDYKELIETEIGIYDKQFVVAGASKLNGGETALVTIVSLDVSTINDQ